MDRRTLIAVSAGMLFLSGCLSEDDGGDADRLDARGEIAIVVDGESIDLTADRFQSEHAENDSAAFHLHEGSDEWFMEGTSPVTVATAIDLLPHVAFERRDGETAVTIDGRTYDAGDAATTIEVRVNDEPIDPTTHELADGERVELTVSTARE